MGGLVCIETTKFWCLRLSTSFLVLTGRDVQSRIFILHSFEAVIALQIGMVEHRLFFIRPILYDLSLFTCIRRVVSHRCVPHRGH